MAIRIGKRVDAFKMVRYMQKRGINTLFSGLIGDRWAIGILRVRPMRKVRGYRHDRRRSN